MLAWAARLPVRIYTTQDGLPQAQVSAIRQDPQGYLWVATRTGGLGRFDGQTWTVFDASSGLPSPGIEALDISPGGTLFLGTNAGAVRREGSRWVLLERPYQMPVLPITAIFAAGDNRAWIGTSEGLWYWRGPGRAAETVKTTKDKEESRIICFARGADNGVWVGTASGLARIDPQDPLRLIPIPGLPAADVRGVLDRAEQGLLVAIYGKGLFSGTPGNFTRIGDDAAPGPFLLSLLAEKNDPDAIWVGTAGQGAFRYDGRSWTRFGRSEGFPEQSIDTMFQDRENIIWFGTSIGLVKRGQAAFATFTEDEGFLDKGRFYGMAESREGDLWFSAYENGLFCLKNDGTVKRYTSRDGLPNAPVNDVEADPSGGVWVATQGGLARIKDDRVRPLALPADMPTDLRTILRTPDGSIYMGTFHDGLFVLEKGRLRTIGSPVGKVIVALWRARDGTIWCGGYGRGAVGLKPEGPPEVIGKSNGLPSDQVTHIFEDSNGALWISTECGVWRRSADGRIRIFDRASGMPDSFVYWTMEDAEGSIWFGTNHGVARLTRDNRWEIYTSRDGLPNDECNEDGVLVDSRGRLYIGNQRVALFLGRPAQTIPPPILLEHVRVGSQFKQPEKVALRPGQGPLVFKLAAPTFVNEESTRIRYRLIGLSEAWNLSEPSQREIAFGGLGPGRYRFEAMAVTEEGLRSEKLITVAVNVPPRWWQSPAFLVLALACIAGGLFMAIRIRERRLDQAKHRLEEQVRLRTDELRLVNERLAELAIKDDLTDLPNRRAVLERLREAMSAARRHNSSLIVAMIDVDNFKEVNDKLGHEIGDTVLRKIAGAMRLCQRQEDTLGRYGGDEFFAVIPGCQKPSAGIVVERLQKAVASVKVEGTESVVGEGGFSVSVGVAILDDTTLAERDLVRKADDSLYRAKAALLKRKKPS